MRLTKNKIYLALVAASLAAPVFASDASDSALHGSVPSVRLTTDVYKRVPIIDVLSSISFPYKVTVTPASGFANAPELKTLVSMMPMRGSYAEVLEKVLSAARLTADYDADTRKLVVRPAEMPGAKTAAADAEQALNKLAGTQPAAADAAGFNPAAISAMGAANLSQLKRDMVSAKANMPLLPSAPTASPASMPASASVLPASAIAAKAMGSVGPQVAAAPALPPVALPAVAQPTLPVPAQSSSAATEPLAKPLSQAAAHLAVTTEAKPAEPVKGAVVMSTEKAQEATVTAASSSTAAASTPPVSDQASKTAAVAVASGKDAAVEAVKEAPAVVPVWKIEGKGESLKKTLASWSQKAGWTLRWELPASDFNLETSAEISGNYLDAVESVVAALRGNGFPLRAVAYEGNKVLRITSPNGPLKTSGQ